MKFSFVALLLSAAAAYAAPIAHDLFCLHNVDAVDHKCFEACAPAGTEFAMKGIEMNGTCDTSFNTIDKTETVLQCPDGVTSIRYCPDTVVNVTVTTKGESQLSTESTKKKILVVGDSWGTVVAAGSKLGASFFARKLKQHGCSAQETSIAVPGTTSTDWTTGSFAAGLKAALVAKPDYVWIILLGNDALEDMPDCAQTKKSASECGDQLFAKAVKNIGAMADTIHKESPDTKVVGFGYDTMFGGLGCGLVTHELFPQCYKIGGGGNRCFNTEFLRIQETWDTVAATRPWVTNTSILGATQVAAGDKKASTGIDRHIDMDKMGPAKYWPDYEGCFHPGVVGGDDSGAMVVMEEFYRVFWSKELGC